MIGCIGLIITLTSYAFFTCFCNLWLLGSAYYSITLRLSIRYSSRFTFPDGALFRLRMMHLFQLAIKRRGTSGFHSFCIPENFKDFRLFHPPLVSPTVEEFFLLRLTEYLERII
jgi:hypothetical protein